MAKVIILIIITLLLGAVYTAREDIKNFYQKYTNQHQPKATTEKTANEELIESTVPAKQMYKWTDKEGRVHFSEKAPDNPEIKTQTIQIETVQTTEFKASPKIKPVYQPNPSRNYTNTSSNLSECARLKKDIKRQEDNLKARKTNAFDKKYKRLREKRWKALKNCY
ncbi:DUF4124 domain-containing protein [Aliikangiella sp. IMCC44359]|uniref:DUF4124 domain-containing protein n=1 Tax=Aliikangiella sp. IMCC44359 TaxID=3459125 RepID=UPI00403A7F20